MYISQLWSLLNMLSRWSIYWTMVRVNRLVKAMPREINPIKNLRPFVAVWCHLVCLTCLITGKQRGVLIDGLHLYSHLYFCFCCFVLYHFRLCPGITRHFTLIHSDSYTTLERSLQSAESSAQWKNNTGRRQFTGYKLRLMAVMTSARGLLPSVGGVIAPHWNSTALLKLGSPR